MWAARHNTLTGEYAIMKTQVLDTLFSARTAVSTLIINLSPTTPGEVSLMNSLMQRRDALTGAINQTIEQTFNDLAPGLDKAEADLQAQTTKLTQLSTTLPSITQAISFVDSIVQAVGNILKLAGT